jgi:hypothetical protein
MRTRRHTQSGESFFRSAPWRGFLRDMGLIAATFIVGYGISVFWLSPGPIFTNDHSLPRVLELPEAQARGKLTQLGLRPRVEGQRPSDSFPAGAIIWQDPPSTSRRRRRSWPRPEFASVTWIRLPTPVSAASSSRLDRLRVPDGLAGPPSVS